MAQPKGKTGNPNGRPVGSKNERTLQWEALGHALLTEHAERARELLAQLPPDKFLDHYGKLLEYFKPKQSRSEVSSTNDTHVTYTIKRGDNNHPTSAPPQAEGTAE